MKIVRLNFSTFLKTLRCHVKKKQFLHIHITFILMSVQMLLHSKGWRQGCVYFFRKFKFQDCSQGSSLDKKEKRPPPPCAGSQLPAPIAPRFLVQKCSCFLTPLVQSHKYTLPPPPSLVITTIATNGRSNLIHVSVVTAAATHQQQQQCVVKWFYTLLPQLLLSSTELHAAAKP